MKSLVNMTFEVSGDAGFLAGKEMTITNYCGKGGFVSQKGNQISTYRYECVGTNDTLYSFEIIDFLFDREGADALLDVTFFRKASWEEREVEAEVKAKLEEKKALKGEVEDGVQ